MIIPHELTLTLYEISHGQSLALTDVIDPDQIDSQTNQKFEQYPWDEMVFEFTLPTENKMAIKLYRGDKKKQKIGQIGQSTSRNSSRFKIFSRWTNLMNRKNWNYILSMDVFCSKQTHVEPLPMVYE